MKYCRWKVYVLEDGAKTLSFKCVRCCQVCKEKRSCERVCKDYKITLCCPLQLTEIEYLLVKLTNKPIEQLKKRR